LLIIRSALIFNVILNLSLVGGVADRVDIVTFGPELTAPQFSFDNRFSFKDLFGGYAFHYLSDVGGAKHRHGLDEKMHMIVVHAYFYKLEVVTFLDFKADILYFLVYALKILKNIPTIFCWAD